MTDQASDTDRFSHDAGILAQALPYMQRYEGKTVVVKYGGHAMGDLKLGQAFARDIALLKQSKVNPIVVHGGGPQIALMLKNLGIESKFEGGLRVTDARTMEVVEMVLAGSINKEIVALINAEGEWAIGLCGKDGNMVFAKKAEKTIKDPGSNIERVLDLGFVGEPIEVDRELSDGEAFHWRGFDFRIWHAPGQTEFHSIISGTIDGTRVAFTGDNIFLYQSQSGERPAQTTVLRNSFQLDMHRRCAEVLQASRPELICPGHGDLIAMSPTRLDEYADFIDRKERAVRDLVGGPADHFVDLFWAQMHPYLSIVSEGDDVLFTVRLRNNLARTAVYEARLILPEGWKTPAGSVSMTLPAGGHGTLDLPATAPHLAHTERKLVTAEILIDGVSQGPICEALVVTRSADRPGPTA